MRIRRLAGHMTGAILAYGAADLITGALRYRYGRLVDDILNPFTQKFVGFPVFYDKLYGTMEAVRNSVLVRAGEHVSQTITDYSRRVFTPGFSPELGNAVGAVLILVSAGIGTVYLFYIGHRVYRALNKEQAEE